MKKRRRPLSADEKRLWAHVARHVKPMKGKRHPDESGSEASPPAGSIPAPAAPAPATPAPASPQPASPQPAGLKPTAARPPRPPSRPAASSPAASSPVAPPPVPPAPPLVGLERRTLQALRRRTRAVDGSIDLHGMRQEEAHFALVGFLRRAQARGHGIVLVITGKGGTGSERVGPGGPGGFMFEERGVLRRMVPHWLRRPDLRSLVVGFEEASPHHGGSGALYVRLRRGRGAGSMDDSLW
ncbi:MAG: Smr/MutS family protein [Microvirga sp.]